MVSSLLLEINKNGICSLFTGKYNFGVVPEWAGAFAPYFLTPPWDFLYERTAPTSGVIVCYPITDTSILGDPGAVSRIDKMFVVKVYCF